MAACSSTARCGFSARAAGASAWPRSRAKEGAWCPSCGRPEPPPRDRRHVAYVLDEPLLGVSPRLVDEACDKTVEMAKNGLTVLFVERNTGRALEISDQAYIPRRIGPWATWSQTSWSHDRAWMAEPPTIRVGPERPGTRRLAAASEARSSLDELICPR